MRGLSIAGRLWPDLENMSGQPQAEGVANVVGTLASLPLAVAGLAWLVAATDLALVRDAAPVLLLILVLYLLAEQLNFFVIVEVEPGRYSDWAGSLSGVILWSAALVFGPTALWIGVIALAAWLARDWRRQTTALRRWSLARNFSLNLVEITLARLTGLAVYGRWGGTIPFPGLTAGAFVPALFATVVQYVLGRLGWLAYVVYAGKVTPRGGGPRPGWRSAAGFAGVAFGLPLLAEPFAILAAALFVENGVPGYLFFVAGLLLASLLAQQLSRAAERSHRQSRQLEKLEQLGRAIIDSPPDGSTLPAVLAEHVPAMFSYAGLEIRVFAGGTLLHDPPDSPPLAEPAWDWMRGQPEACIFRPGDALPWDGRPGHDVLVVAPILDVASGQPAGGIALTVHRIVEQLDASAAARVVPAVNSLAAQVASALHRAGVYAETLAHQRVVRELELAGQIQASFLPVELPACDGWQVAAALKPARQTSGDFYDAIPLPGGRLGVVIADVAGKGMGAALYMALTRTLVRTYALELDVEPARALAAANRRILADTRAEQFVTVFYGILDPASGTLTYCNAGHPPAYVLSGRDGAVLATLGTSGIPLGIEEEAGWESGEVRLAPGDVLVLYTDGVTEAQDAREEMWGSERLVDAARGRLHLPAAEMAAALVGEVEAFAGDAAQYDDVTVVVAKRNPYWSPAA